MPAHVLLSDNALCQHLTEQAFMQALAATAVGNLGCNGDEDFKSSFRSAGGLDKLTEIVHLLHAPAALRKRLPAVPWLTSPQVSQPALAPHWPSFCPSRKSVGPLQILSSPALCIMPAAVKAPCLVHYTVGMSQLCTSVCMAS